MEAKKIITTIGLVIALITMIVGMDIHGNNLDAIKANTVTNAVQEVSRCVGETYHDTPTDSYVGNQDGNRHTNTFVDVNISKCEAIKNLMLSVK